MNKINVWDVDEFFIDIGTPESLECANNFLDNKKVKDSKLYKVNIFKKPE